jgi:hypothetical protein
MSTRKPNNPDSCPELAEAAVFAELALDALGQVPANDAEAVAATVAADSIRAGLDRLRAAGATGPPIDHSQDRPAHRDPPEGRALFHALSLVRDLAESLTDELQDHECPAGGDGPAECRLCKLEHTANKVVAFSPGPLHSLGRLFGGSAEAHFSAWAAHRALSVLLSRARMGIPESRQPAAPAAGPRLSTRGNPRSAEALYVLWTAAGGVARQLSLDLAGHHCQEPVSPDDDGCLLCGLEESARHAVWALSNVDEEVFENLREADNVRDLGPRLRVILGRDLFGADQAGAPTPDTQPLIVHDSH